MGLAQDRLDTIRARAVANVFEWDLITTDNIDTTYTLDGTEFELTSTIEPDPYDNEPWKIITLTVGWEVRKRSGAPVPRTIEVQSVVFKDVTPGVN